MGDLLLKISVTVRLFCSLALSCCTSFYLLSSTFVSIGLTFLSPAFLISWLLDEDQSEEEEDNDDIFMNSIPDNLNLRAKSHQADKALLSCIKISMALHYDDYFLEGMNELAKSRLVTKLSERKGPIVQMGFGLHAGKAYVGAIGSQRKIDATYSE